MENILNKKYPRHKPNTAVPEERVVAIKVKADRSVRVGLSWSPEVADFYMELYPDMLEYGFSLQDMSMFDQGVFWE